MAPEVMVVNLKQNAPCFWGVWQMCQTCGLETSEKFCRKKDLDMKTKTEIFVVTVQNW